MKNALAALLLLAALSSGCALTPTVPVAVACPPPRPIPDALKIKSATTLEPLNVRGLAIETEFDSFLTRERK